MAVDLKLLCFALIAGIQPLFAQTLSPREGATGGSTLFLAPQVLNPNSLQPPQIRDSLQFNLLDKEYFKEEFSLPPEAPYRPETKREEGKIGVEVIPCEEGAWRLVFCFSKEVSYEETYDECGGLSLSFDQRVDTADLAIVQEKLAYLMKRIANGYHVLYFLPERHVCFYTEKQGRYFILDIVPQYGCPEEATRLLKLARARLLVEEYFYYQAFEALEELLTLYPGDKDSLLLLGTLENLLPRWQKSFEIFSDLNFHYPCDENIKRLMHDVYYPHSSFVNFTRQIQQTPDFSVYQINRLTGEWIMNRTPWNTFYAGGIFDYTRGHLSTVVQGDGESEGFLGNRFQGTLYARKECVWGDAYTGRFYAGEGGVYGGGVEGFWLWPGIQGSFDLLFDWNRPYWELFETFEFYGRHDRILFEIDSVYDRYFDWDFGGGVQRIGISGVPTALVSILVSGDINWHLQVGNPIVTLNYGFEAQYVQYEKEKIDAAGERFVRVPLNSYEFHLFRAYLQWEFCYNWYFSGFGGVSLNRLGINDWTGGATLIYRKPCPCGWEAELSWVRIPSTNVSGAYTNYLTFSVTARF